MRNLLLLKSPPVFPGFVLKSLAALLVLAAVNGLLYFPARHQPFGLDQLHYMADLNGDRSLSAGMKRLDYCNSRLYWKGDESLYRPLLFGWLGILNSGFGDNYPYWNLMQLSLHVLFCFCFFLLLSQSAGFLMAFIFSLAFSVSPNLFELNVDPHLGGYLWSYLFFILTLLQIFKMEKCAEAWTNRDMLVLVSAMTLCLFFFEIFNGLILLPVLYLIVSRAVAKKPGFTLKQLAILALPFVVFALLYFFVHAKGSKRISYIDSFGGSLSFEQRFHSKKTILIYVLKTFQDWLALLIAPMPPTPRLFGLAQAALLVFSAVTAVSLRRLGRILLFLGCLLAYLALLCSGRPAPPMHHYNFFLLLYWLLFFYTVDVKRFRLTLLVLLAGLTVSGAVATWALSKSVESNFAARYDYYLQLKQFIETKKDERSFSFRIEQSSPQGVDPMISLRAGYADDGNALITYRRYSQIIFARYYEASNPRYELTWDKRSFQVKRMGDDSKETRRRADVIPSRPARAAGLHKKKRAA